MALTNDLITWLNFNDIYYTDEGASRLSIPSLGRCIEVEVQNLPIINSYQGLMSLNMDKEQINRIIYEQIDFVIFKFGKNYYHTPITHILNVKLNPLLNVGEYKGFIPPNETSRAFLGIHGRYEAMSGTRDYSDWCKRAKYFNVKYLGICERNTLAGTLPFQLACKKNAIVPIIGYTTLVQPLSPDPYEIKLYVINEIGWSNLLLINKIINIDQDSFLSEKQLMECSEGLALVLSAGPHINHHLIDRFSTVFNEIYFQITTTEYLSQDKELGVLMSIKDYLNDDAMQSKLSPILISDAYCIDPADTHIKRLLNKQGNVQFSYATTKHYFKSIETCFMELEQLFDPNDNRLDTLFQRCLSSFDKLTTVCTFNIDTKTLHLPKYEMTVQDQVHANGTEQLFNHLIDVGIERELKLGKYTAQQLEERIENEYIVIKKGGFIDYFLILWDIVNWCDKNNIQVGPGRGSAAGCLISYLLGVVRINPLDYDLLFERFLNESRIESELPDIDIDFASDRREEVIEYMRTRYGADYVCRVGTYGTLQMKGVIKELTRVYGINGTHNINFINNLISEDNENWQPIFSDALANPALKAFVIDNPQIIDDARIALNSIKSTSMHACATIIVPKRFDAYNKPLNIFKQIPIRKDESGALVSEWEGEIMAEAGFLKEDILSTKQMAKIGHMIDLIEQRHGKRINVQEIPLDDPDVFELFRTSQNQDVFHFGSRGLTAYLKDMQPETIHDLIAAIALYRPGAMVSNAHTDYNKLKRGELEPQYDFNLYEVTKFTYGLYCFQEQIMQAVQILGGFTLTEADGVRKAMGKKIKEKMDGYRVQFLKGAISQGCPQEEAEYIWNKLEVFSGYGFNKSHAAAYAVIGYYCNWFKAHYPLEFWTVAFQFGKEDKIKDYVGEINKSGKISTVSPDINKSGMQFYSDDTTQKIYWNLTQIKFVGEAAAQQIVDERNLNGKFFSMEEFCSRTMKGAVNIRVIEHLVLTGCFDEMYRINVPRERYDIMRLFYEQRKKDTFPQEYFDNKDIHHYWSLRQSELCGLSKIDYPKLLEQSQFKECVKEYIDLETLATTTVDESVVTIVGTISECVIRKTKKDQREFAVITVTQDDRKFNIRVWPEELITTDQRFLGLKDFVRKPLNRLCIFRGNVKYNDFPSINCNEMTLSSRIKGPIFQIF